ncbi:unnamed protein product [Meloidogyne enterolobii]|uniref:Uncharacterized protein n=2 Tax=Meloidogyne enterolobii TaxID=390850 RepID=A0ACB0YHP8_MELEN
MPIVMHKLTEHKIKSSELISKRLESAKDVRNLLWTAVAVAERKLVDNRKGVKIVDKGTQTCLLEFIARMVGGAYTPFAFIKEDSKNFKSNMFPPLSWVWGWQELEALGERYSRVKHVYHD